MKNLQDKIKLFCAERDWQQYHDPKSLAIAVSVEAAEVLEHFMWLTGEESRQLTPKALAEVADEIGDVMICLTNLAMQLGIDPVAAAHAKLAKVALKYPVEKAKGKALKYDKLEG
jgi:NTP pyrophosphatase (non-canonical NTP hydrolase)